MYFLRPKRIDEIIVSTLLLGEISTAELLLQVRERRDEAAGGAVHTTKQSFYAALRRLKREEIVITYRKKVSLNTSWLSEMRDAFTHTQAVYTSKNTTSDFLSLADKESVTYSFSSIRNMDTFWGHTWNVLTGAIAPSEPLYVFDPHYWFYFARYDLERKFQREITARGRQYLMTVSGKTPLDKAIKKDFQGDYLQYNHEQVFPKDTYYLTIIGDYIAEAHLDPSAAAKIRSIFESHATATPAVIAGLQEVLEAPIRSTIKISRNKAKAEKLKKRLGKNFYIKKNV